MKEFDEYHWSYVQAPEEMFVLRRFDFDDDTLHLLRKWLGLGRPNLKIVEMGSGSGYFTEQLLKASNNSFITCVEPDDTLRKYAEARLEKKATFLKGFVENPPLPRDIADLVICYILLCNVPDIPAAVKGMMNVAKPGGAVCCIEPLFAGGYHPDPRANLIVEGHSANIKGAWMRRKELIPYPEEDPNRAYSYPRVFVECGLSQVEMYTLATCYYSGDWRWNREDQLQLSRNWLNLLNKHKARYEANLRRSGWKKDRIEALFKAWRNFHTEILQRPEKLIEDHGVFVKCSGVTIGRKIS